MKHAWVGDLSHSEHSLRIPLPRKLYAILQPQMNPLLGNLMTCYRYCENCGVQIYLLQNSSGLHWLTDEGRKPSDDCEKEQMLVCERIHES